MLGGSVLVPKAGATVLTLLMMSLLSPKLLVVGFSLKFSHSSSSIRGVTTLQQDTCPHDDDNVVVSPHKVNRRSMLMSLITGSSLPLIIASSSSLAHADSSDTVTSAVDAARVTHKVFMDVRVSRADGTFYVRDDLPDTPDNTVYYSRLVFGLFGELAPQHVKQFLMFVDSNNSSPLEDEDNPLPSYGRSSFKSLDQATGLLLGGYIPGLEVTSIGGGTAIKYGGRILPAPLWVENSGIKLDHSTKGLLTHRNLDVSPTFGITTRSCPELDSTHYVFGKLIMDESTSQFLNLVQDIPTYSVDRPPALEETAIDDVAKSVFNGQRDFFRGVAKSFGDSRLDKVYNGKLLRRVEVTKVGLL